MRKSAYVVVVVAGVLIMATAVFAGEDPADQSPVTEIADAAVVLAVDSVAPEETAARELAQYLLRITGRQVEVMREREFDGETPGIYVGWTQFARRHGCTPEGLPMDAFRIKSAGKNLILCGNRPRGTFYAVAQYLEDWYGVRWFTVQGEELVPPHDSLRIPETDRVFKPAFASRDLMAPHELSPAGDERLERWLAFNRINGPASDMHGASGPSERFGGTYYPQLGLFVHNMSHVFIRPDEHFDQHPEYYALHSDGTRSPRALCMTNAKMRAQFLVELRELLAKEPEKRQCLISISPADGAAYCSCADCTATTGPWAQMGYILNPSYLELVNYLARSIREEHPDARLEYLAYGRAEWYAPHPDPKKRPESNVIVRYAPIHKYHWGPIDCELNKPWMDILKAWRTRTDSLRVWDYPHHYGFGASIFPRSYSAMGDSGLRKWVESAVRDPDVAAAGWCLTLTAGTGSEAKHYVNVNGYGAFDMYESPTLTVVYRTTGGDERTVDLAITKSDISFLTESGSGTYHLQNQHTAAEISGSPTSQGAKSIALLRFDVSGIPREASIVDARFRLQKCGEEGVASDGTFAVHELPRGQAWGPGVLGRISDKPLSILPAPKGLQGFGGYDALMPQPNTFTVLRNLGIYRTNGMNGIFLETDARGLSSLHCMADLHYWVFARGMWDQTHSPDEIVWDFCSKYYGAGGGSVFNYLKLLERAYVNDPVRLRIHLGNMALQRFFGLDFAIEAHFLFDQAEKTAGTDEVLLERLRRARMDLDVATLFYLNRFREEYREKHGTLRDFPFDRQHLADRYYSARMQLMSRFYPNKAEAEEKAVKELLLAAKGMPNHW